ncbi:MAG: hypothetical protein SFX73_21530 [Kofleriaceae bacterium]|nr:hypothetical protein [Kofleriaceae bacterium]
MGMQVRARNTLASATFEAAIDATVDANGEEITLLVRFAPDARVYFWRPTIRASCRSSQRSVCAMPMVSRSPRGHASCPKRPPASAVMYAIIVVEKNSRTRKFLVTNRTALP